MDDRKLNQPVNGSYGLTQLEQLDRRIQTLEQEIPIYSNKAAEAMVQGMEDNTYRLETERRLEELNKLKEERRRLRPDSALSIEAGAPRSSHPSPHGSTAPLGSPAASAASLQAARMAQPRPSVGPSTPVIGVPAVKAPPQSRKQVAMAAADAKLKYVTSQDCPFMCSHFLEYNDLIAMACVSKFWRHRVRKTPGWRRIVMSLEQSLLGHVGKITALALYEQYIVTGSSDGKVKFWDPTKGFACVKTLNITPSPAHRYVHPRIKDMREQSTYTLAAPEDDEFAEYPLAVTSLLTVEKCVVMGAEDGRIIVWIASSQDRKEYEWPLHHKAVTCLIQAGDEAIFTGSLDGNIALLNRKSFPFNAHAPPVWQTPLYGRRKHDSGVTAMAVAGGHLFSGTAEGKIHVWLPRTMEFRKYLVHVRPAGTNGMQTNVEHTDRITSMVGSSERLYTASWDGTIKLWNARVLECIRDVPVMPLGICWSLALRRDSSGKSVTLVGGVRDSDIAIMDADTLDVLATCEETNWAYRLDRHMHWVKCIMSFPDGRIVTGSDDWTAKVWHVRGTSYGRIQTTFFGLPSGPLTKEDIEIILTQVLKGKTQTTVDQLQKEKAQHDKVMKEKMAAMTPEQLAHHDASMKKAAESWTRARERQKTLTGGGNADAASSTPLANATPQASTTPGASVLSSTNGAEATPASDSNPEPIPQTPADRTPETPLPVVKKEPDENGMHPSLTGESTNSEEAPQEATDAADEAAAPQNVEPSESGADNGAPDQPSQDNGDGRTSASPVQMENGESATTVADDEEDDGEGSEDGPDGKVKRRRVGK